MALNSANVLVAVSGGVYAAPLATALPTTVGGALNVAFLELGYLDESGVVEGQATSSNKIRAWQNGDTVREVQTEHDLTFKFVAIETNPVVLAEYYGNYNSTTKLVEISGLQPGRHPWVFEVLDGAKHVRVVVPSGQITERGDISYLNGDPIGYEMTVTAYPDPAYAGSLAAPAKAYKYMT